MINLAHDIAKKKFGKTFPNPTVGCIIAKNSKIISKAVTNKSGQKVSQKDLEIWANDADPNLYQLLHRNLKPLEKRDFFHNHNKLNIVLISGVNGVGKTTTIGKIGKILKENGNKVVLSASDTFRAAAIDQLDKWAKKINVEIIKSEPGSDPASVAFKAIQHAKDKSLNQVIIDTAGRLQNKKNLMEEYKKIANVAKKIDSSAPHQVVLILDATSGQNVINQVDEFNKIIPLTGLIMTKLDGTAKGGILLALAKKYKLPIIGLGLGEKEDDFQIFDAEKFAKAFIQ